MSLSLARALRPSLSALMRSARTSLPRRAYSLGPPPLASSAHAKDPDEVTIVEVGPRDGLQNEKGVIPAEVKAQLIDRLAAVGLHTIEAGSFVSPKWVPQMADTEKVLALVHPHPDTSYPVLVPNAHGLAAFLALPHRPAAFDEIAVFTAASDAFNKANTNVTVAESLARLAPVVADARARGLRVRGYVSTAVECPFSGPVPPAQVRAVAEALIRMGCYEVSLGDTVGKGTPATVRAMLAEVSRGVPVRQLAGHFHDTYGMGVANALAALECGVRTLDTSVGGLGGCPYAPGATGNVATEDVLYALRGSRFRTRGRAEDRLLQLAEVGWWISGVLGRETTSRVGRAMWAARERAKL